MHATSLRGSLVSDLHMPAMLGTKRDNPRDWGAKYMIQSKITHYSKKNNFR